MGHKGTGHSLVYSQLNLNLIANAVVEVGAWALGRRRRFRVSGSSMQPTLSDGEFVLIDSNRKIIEGVVVVADHPTLSEIMIKRVQSLDEHGLWLLSDNSEVGTDSRRFGAVAPTSVHGVVTLILSRPVTPLDSVG